MIIWMKNRGIGPAMIGCSGHEGKLKAYNIDFLPESAKGIGPSVMVCGGHEGRPVGGTEA